MASQVRFDYSLASNVISEDEIKSMEKITNDAKDVLLSKSGAGSDFPSGGTAFGFCGICPASENLRNQPYGNGISAGSVAESRKPEVCGGGDDR